MLQFAEVYIDILHVFQEVLFSRNFQGIIAFTTLPEGERQPMMQYDRHPKLSELL
jgi:hypothetical protein